MTAYISTGSGDWNNVATWGGGGYPQAGDTAQIDPTHIVDIDNSTGSQACRSVTLKSSASLAGGKLRITASSADVGLTLGAPADNLKYIKIENGTNNGELIMTGTADYKAFIAQDTPNPAYPVELLFNGTLDLTFAEFQDIDVQDGYIDVDGGTLTLEDFDFYVYKPSGGNPFTTRYYLKGIPDSYSATRAAWENIQHSLYYDGSDYFIFTEDPNAPKSLKPPLEYDEPIPGRDYSRTGISGIHSKRIIFSGLFYLDENKWKTEDLEIKFKSRIQYCYFGPTDNLLTCKIQSFERWEEPAEPANYYYNIILAEV